MPVRAEECVKTNSGGNHVKILEKTYLTVSFARRDVERPS